MKSVSADVGGWRPPAPVKLDRKLRDLGTQRTQKVDQPDPKAVQAILRRLASRVGGADLKRNEISAIVRYYTEAPPEDRELILNVVSSASRIAWRKLWFLWEQRRDHSGITLRLADKLAQRVANRPRFAETSLPPWLGSNSESIRVALSRPESAIRNYCESTNVTLDAVCIRCQITPGLPLADHTLVDLVRTGTSEWWHRNSPEEIREWVADQSLELKAAVAERQLLDLGGEANGPADLAQLSDRRSLYVWVNRILGDPLERPGSWKRVSDRARQIFEWMLLVDEFDKIIALFRRSSEDRRGKFWERYLAELRDARFVNGEDTAICMMVLSDTLVIEFGSTGNACYFYRAPTRIGPLRGLGIHHQPNAAEFKSRRGLSVGAETLGYRHKLSHIGPWEQRFESYLQRDLGVPCPQTTQRWRKRTIDEIERGTRQTDAKLPDEARSTRWSLPKTLYADDRGRQLASTLGLSRPVSSRLHSMLVDEIKQLADRHWNDADGLREIATVLENRRTQKAKIQLTVIRKRLAFLNDR